ncbi:Pol polyprotein [Plakobranchus ocellatus]|uniref:Pol polyprotein n=1 Tax=Plakobranchus ocellatus TaxID=259542 RepID=A0AAV3ZAQ7_9GAST|nr:Pol polyprotein [Plakobranchus ocellatus]
MVCQDQHNIVTVLCNWTAHEIIVPASTCMGTAYALSRDEHKQRAEDVHRRNPAIRSCQGEEDAHPDKVLEAGVVQPSVSEWASPSVLVRKRDDSVRWCVDYQAVNKITRKDVFPYRALRIA